jgi:hypothetical protein
MGIFWIFGEPSLVKSEGYHQKTSMLGQAIASPSVPFKESIFPKT